jgi:hypothetical protein
MGRPAPHSLILPRSLTPPEAFSVLLAMTALALWLWLHSPQLHLSAAALAGHSLGPAALADIATRRYGPRIKSKGLGPFIVRTAARWTTISAGVALCHVTPRRVADSIVSVAVAFCLTWWIAATIRRRKTTPRSQSTAFKERSAADDPSQ